MHVHTTVLYVATITMTDTNVHSWIDRSYYPVDHVSVELAQTCHNYSPLHPQHFLHALSLKWAINQSLYCTPSSLTQDQWYEQKYCCYAARKFAAFVATFNDERQSLK